MTARARRRRARIVGPDVGTREPGGADRGQGLQSISLARRAASVLSPTAIDVRHRTGVVGPGRTRTNAEPTPRSARHVELAAHRRARSRAIGSPSPVPVTRSWSAIR